MPPTPSHTTVEGVWSDGHAQLWRVALSDGETLTTQFMVAATGFPFQRRVPFIPGNGRRTAVIGTGFTGAQVIPELAKEVSALSGYQHTRMGMLPKSDSVFLLAVQADPGRSQLQATDDIDLLLGFHQTAYAS